MMYVIRLWKICYVIIRKKKKRKTKLKKKGPRRRSKMCIDDNAEREISIDHAYLSCLRFCRHTHTRKRKLYLFFFLSVARGFDDKTRPNGNYNTHTNIIYIIFSPYLFVRILFVLFSPIYYIFFDETSACSSIYRIDRATFEFTKIFG